MSDSDYDNNRTRDESPWLADADDTRFPALDGDLHAVSAICPHMGCILQWNDGGRTWDCPCHGSRFSHEGKVLDGPAVEDLRERSARRK